MSKQITVPDIGDFENVEIIEILVKQGDQIKKNDPIITLESDKSSVEVPSTEEGLVEKINVKVGDKVSKGDSILIINSKIEDTKSALPPTTEKIIHEAEKSLEVENNIERTNISHESKIKKDVDRITINNTNDIDPLETKEWLESLNAVVDNAGNERAHFLLRQLIDQSYRKGSRIPFIQNTPYINTIPPNEEEKSSGDQNIERKIRSLI